MKRIALFSMVAGATAAVAGVGALAAFRTQARDDVPAATPLVTGKSIAPEGTHVGVGSFPASLLLSPDGRFLVATNTGFRQNLTVLDANSGAIVSQLSFKAPNALYYGLAWGKNGPDGTATLYVSHGNEGKIGVFTLGPADGKLTDTGRAIDNGKRFTAGIALTADGATLIAANNDTSDKTDRKGSVSRFDLANGDARTEVPNLPGFPLDVLAAKNGTVYVSSERDGVVSVLQPGALTPISIPTGSHPVRLLLNRDETRLLVANADSDTVSVIDTKSNKVAQTIIVRPAEARGLPGASPLGLALSPDEKRLYVTLADMNAVAVVDLPGGSVAGYIPVGWYPTAVVATPDGKRLFVANAKGTQRRNPNGKPVPGIETQPQYGANIIEGTIAKIDVPTDAALARMTPRVFETNRLAAVAAASKPSVSLPKIEHVFYIIKENRTYDQILGDVAKGNGDPSLVLFGKDVTPNQHALADRFVLLDNFYCCAEVSADGWNWSTSGMANEYVERNTFTNYSRRGRAYDFEGTNNGVPVDLVGLPNVARAPGGYLWEAAAKKGVSIRNYGFFVTFQGDAERGPEGTPGTTKVEPNQKILVGKTDTEFAQFDMTYPDSDAWLTHRDTLPARLQTKFGKFNATSRYAEWKREFDAFVRNKNLPRLSMIRLPRDHTSGATAGVHSPRAMVADNDYGVGQIVEAISKSPYWKSSAIFVVEDDAQNGFDHVDSHRSIAFVISPFVRKSAVDSRFYNTDSVLRTMELLLGIPPMNQYDAGAPVLDVFAKSSADNDAPYAAILPARAILTEVNTRRTPGAAESAKLDLSRPDAAPDDILTRIVWHAVKGANTPTPQFRGRVSPKGADDDDD